MLASAKMMHGCLPCMRVPRTSFLKIVFIGSLTASGVCCFQIRIDFQGETIIGKSHCSPEGGAYLILAQNLHYNTLIFRPDLRKQDLHALWIRWAFIGLCVSAIFAPNVQKLAEAKHWDAFLIQYWDPFTSWLAALTGALWFWFLFGLSLGIALGMWASKFFAEATSRKVPTVGEQLSNAPSDLAQKVTPPADRIFADATPADLRKLFEGKTDTQAQQQLSLYLRTWFKVSGSLHDLTENSVNLSEHMFPQSIYHLVMVFRDERWLVRLRTMPVGRRLTIIGEFVGANKLMIYLDNCELLEEEA
jgi:hypothetical protein